MALSQAVRSKRWRDKYPERQAAATNAWRLSHKQERNKYMRVFRKENKEQDYINQHRNRLKRKYGITPEQYDAMIMQQGGKCAICETTEPDKRYKRFHIDHCHETGRVRGILCKKCNLALGHFNDNIESIERALRYLKRGLS